MVRRSLNAALAGIALAACEPQSDMAESVEMPDTTALHDAMIDPERRGALLDTLPGGEMVVGDSAAEMELLREKMPRRRP